MLLSFLFVVLLHPPQIVVELLTQVFGRHTPHASRIGCMIHAHVLQLGHFSVSADVSLPAQFTEVLSIHND